MIDPKASPRNWRGRALLVVLLLPVLSICASARKSQSWALAQFETAERLREALSDRPEQERSRREFQRAISAYRSVYFGLPTSTRAAASAFQVAELLLEMGRQFEDKTALQAAVRQYQFLRREYPGSSLRVEALFTIGEIYKDDLGDGEQARAAFEEFVRRYARHRLAGEARGALAELTEQAAAKAKDSSQEKRAEDKERGPDSTAKTADEDAAKSDARLVRITGVRHLSLPDYTRVTIDLEHDVPYESQRIENPARVYFDLAGTELDSTLLGKTLEVDDDFLRQIRVAQHQPGRARIVLDVSSLCEYSSFVLSNPSRLVIDVRPKKGSEAETAADTMAKTGGQAVIAASTAKPRKVIVEPDADDASDPALKPEPGEVKAASKTAPLAAPRSRKEPASRKGKSTPARDIREARPTSNGDHSLIRALGLKIGKIVIDPGHGGYDTGTIGPKGLAEKTLVLDVSRRLGKLLQTRLGADVVQTRSDDTFIPLETRTSIANQEQADLFVSIHANSSHDPDARGVETYYLNFTSSEEALEVAARENATSETSIHELQDLVKKIALKEKIEESREFASDVQQALHSTLAAKTPAIRDRGVKKAPFVVLIGANMPSILAEVSFVSNPADERKLKTAEYRQRIAESLYRGIAKYVSGLSGVKVASRVEKSVVP